MQRITQRPYLELVAAASSLKRVTVTKDEHALLETISQKGFGADSVSVITELEKINSIFRKITGMNLPAGLYEREGRNDAKGLVRQLLSICIVAPPFCAATLMTEGISR